MDHVNKQKTTAFDWAMNSGNSKVLRHLVRSTACRRTSRGYSS